MSGVVYENKESKIKCYANIDIFEFNEVVNYFRKFQHPAPFNQMLEKVYEFGTEDCKKILIFEENNLKTLSFIRTIDNKFYGLDEMVPIFFIKEDGGINSLELKIGKNNDNCSSFKIKESVFESENFDFVIECFRDHSNKLFESLEREVLSLNKEELIKYIKTNSINHGYFISLFENDSVIATEIILDYMFRSKKIGSLGAVSGFNYNKRFKDELKKIGVNDLNVIDPVYYVKEAFSIENLDFYDDLSKIWKVASRLDESILEEILSKVENKSYVNDFIKLSVSKPSLKIKIT